MTTIEHMGLRFAVVDIDFLMKKAELLTSQSVPWHFHGLYRDCMFNPRPDMFAVVLENEAAGENFVSFLDHSPKDYSKRLVAIRTGADLSELRLDTGGCCEDCGVLDAARSLTALGAKWHHHHLRPACVFNKTDGRYQVVIESANEPPLFDEFDREPTAVVSEIDRIYFDAKI